MLRFSYKVLLKNTEAEMLALRIDYERNPSAEKQEKIAEKEKELEWVKGKIARGEDPGTMVL